MGGVAAHPEVFRSDESGSLTVIVKGPDDEGIPDVSVEVWMLRGGAKTDGDGKKSWEGLELLKKGDQYFEWIVRCNKAGFGTPAGPGQRVGENQVEERWLPTKPKESKELVVRMAPASPIDPDARLDGIHVDSWPLPGLRARKVAEGTFDHNTEKVWRETTKERAFTEGEALILISSRVVTLRAHSTKEGSPATAKWSIKRMDKKKGGEPALQEFDRGAGAWLHTNVTGRFRVFAAKDASKDAEAFHVDVVIVGLTVTASVRTLPASGYTQKIKDKNIEVSAGASNIRKTEPGTPGAAIQLDATIKLSDFSPEVSKAIQVWGLNNILESDVGGDYATGNVRESWKSKPPLLDTSHSGKGDQNGAATRFGVVTDRAPVCEESLHFIFLFMESRWCDDDGKGTYKLSVTDPPSLEYALKHPKNGSDLKAFVGTLKFRMGVAAYTRSIPDMVWILGHVEWEACYEGKVEGGKWTAGPKAGASAKGYVSVSPPVPATELGFKIGSPVYTSGNGYKVDYSP